MVFLIDMKKKIVVLLSMSFGVLSITSCLAIKAKFPNVYAYFNKAYGFDDDEVYNQTNIFYRSNIENNSLDSSELDKEPYIDVKKAQHEQDLSGIDNSNSSININVKEEKNFSNYEVKTKSESHANTNYKLNKNKYKHFGIIFSGPSGVGKTTIINDLKKRYVSDLDVSISATTRLKRTGEINAKDYYFLDIEMFKRLLADGEFLEYANNYGNYYGTPKRNYFDAIDNDKDIILSLSVDGMKEAVKHEGMDFVTIFIAPPSYDVLKKQLVGRGTETKAQVNKRLASAKKEIEAAEGLYNYVIYNYDIENSVDVIDAIYISERKKREIYDNKE